MFRILFALGLCVFYWTYLFADFRRVETIRTYIYDFTVSGGVSNTEIVISTATTNTQTLPLNVIVESVDLKVVTPLVSSSMNTSLTVGNSTSSAGYFLARPISDFTDNKVLVGDGGLIWDSNTKLRRGHLVSGTSDRNFVLKVSAGTSISAGKILFKVKSYLPSED